jgi:DNA-binding PadR family transcriptional regulator
MIIRTFSENLHQFLVLNTIKQAADGLSFSELKTMNAANPPSFLYRELRKLVDENYLEQTGIQDQREREGGRPKQRFTLTETGKQRLESLQGSLRSVLEGITRLLPNDQDIDVGEFLEFGTFQGQVNPIDHLLQRNDRSTDEKLKILGEIEAAITAQLAKVRAAVKQLQDGSTEDPAPETASGSFDQASNEER